jgi:UDP-N-acetylmuramoyl-tripeptide--D-alanyl-D-alanine ligase
VKWDLATVAAATAGRATGDATIQRVVTDSRVARDGDLFVAIHGEHVDGHEFAADAARSGAALLVEAGRLPAGSAGVEVGDTLSALAALAAARRSEISAPVVAITGSSGKTTTKDLAAAALGPGTHAAPRSYNNEVGVPVTLLDTPDDASAVVVEVGSRGIGHILALGPVIRPEVAVITNVGPAHLEMFGDVETVRRAKWEIVEILEPGGVAVLPAADSRLLEMGTGPTLTFGEDVDADVSVHGVTLDERGRARFAMRHGAAELRLTMALAGRHQPLNAAAAVAASIATGTPFAEAAGRAAAAHGSPWRMEVVERAIGGGTVVVVNDAYNANPDSMTAAFRTVAGMPGRHLAVLGKMHELGSAEADLHRRVGADAVAAGFEAVVVVGEDPGIAAGAGTVAVPVADAAGAVAFLADHLRPGDVVLVKASRASALETIAGSIGEEAGA